jgi:hypothetical protein
MSTIGVLIAPLTVLALAMPGTPAVAAAPSADPPRPGATISAYVHNYGAIALAMTGGAVGWSYDYPNKWLAGKRAKNECKQSSDYPWTCKKIAWVRDGCLALAVRYDGMFVDVYGWGTASTKRGAYLRALDECGYGCKRRAYTCTTR